MCKCKSAVELLQWHKAGASSDGIVKSVVDFVAWKHINEKWP
jgi:hypothetical protein